MLDPLPPRSTEVLRIEPTEEQLDLHGTHMRVVSSIVSEPLSTEIHRLRLRKALRCCRLAADGTFLVDRKLPGHSSKLERLFDPLFEEESRQAIPSDLHGAACKPEGLALAWLAG